MKRAPPIMVVVLSLVTGACSDSAKQAGAGTAEGEILEGSASDTMLPLDTVKSQAPLAPRVEESGKAKVKDEKVAGAVGPDEKSEEAAEPLADDAARDAQE